MIGSRVVDDPRRGRIGIDVVVLAAQEAVVTAEPVSAEDSGRGTYRRHASA
ncbi:hypothetical protein [Streptomyces canus]|uniref:hypothetical protein n=1 Tax=Streptomyces canus TaxID=58343 RepID=UPI002DDBCAD3|nr:hypothetical protein [Streptomyces canus]WSD84257.1 hypothetical protein OG925_08105 [Streptomyces canus]